MSTTCRSCNALIFWAVTPAGKRIPINVEPVTDGNMVLRTQAGDDGVEVLDEPMLAISVNAEMLVARDWITGTPLFVSHFSTCKDAGKWRRK